MPLEAITDTQLNHFRRNDAEKSIMFIKIIFCTEASDEKLLLSDLFLSRFALFSVWKADVKRLLDEASRSMGESREDV